MKLALEVTLPRETRQPPKSMLDQLDAIGVTEAPRAPKHAVVKPPVKRDPMQSQGWKPSYPGEAPPF